MEAQQKVGCQLAIRLFWVNVDSRYALGGSSYALEKRTITCFGDDDDAEELSILH